jgi:hypothetical protein
MGNQDNNSFRDGVDGSRQLFAPSISWQINPDLNWLVQYEYSRYNRTPDRGIPGVNGRPADVSRSATYGDPARLHRRPRPVAALAPELPAERNLATAPYPGPVQARQ